jgi:tRNA(Arg) A34 adenosine deaminase TadA
MTLSDKDKIYLQKAIQLADKAAAFGNHPFGCVITAKNKDDPEDSKIVVEAMNSVHTAHDTTGHAETNAIRALGQYIHDKNNNSNVLYELFTSTEPCMQCCAAVVWSYRIFRVVYACPESGLAKYAGDDFLCPCREVFARAKNKIVVEGPFMEDEAVKAHAKYWPAFFEELNKKKQ